MKISMFQLTLSSAKSLASLTTHLTPKDADIVVKEFLQRSGIKVIDRGYDIKELFKGVRYEN